MLLNNYKCLIDRLGVHINTIVKNRAYLTLTHMHATRKNYVNINQKYVREAYAYFFSEQECDLVTVLECINITLLQRKSCSVQMLKCMVIHSHTRYVCACSSALFTFHNTCLFLLIKWNIHIQCRNGVINLLACSVETFINRKLSSEYCHLFLKFYDSLLSF